MELKTLKDLRIEEELCEKLDSEVYLPVKKELEGIGMTYSLGSRKEDFKGLIEKKFNDLKQEAIKWIKEEIKIWDSRHPLSTKGKTIEVPVIKRWMNRFNINEEDLK